MNNLKGIKCFPIFISKKIYRPKQNNIFLIGDAFFAFPPTFAQGASQSIEAAFELYKNFQNGSNEFTNQRIERTKMINKRSKFKISYKQKIFIMKTFFATCENFHTLQKMFSQ